MMALPHERDVLPLPLGEELRDLVAGGRRSALASTSQRRRCRGEKLGSVTWRLVCGPALGWRACSLVCRGHRTPRGEVLLSTSLGASATVLR